ncbi:unnamed protein product [Cyclocybe aegerita]|uniref:HNH nuclease domain-containing protein n=1 Tax=Cyclocybe aegerita TaxID=1973307 RepID=A0A8S0WPQ0_CYCAE|nr:unnamed protein product [Cyclocybe aegerita]
MQDRYIALQMAPGSTDQIKGSFHHPGRKDIQTAASIPPISMIPCFCAKATYICGQRRCLGCGTSCRAELIARALHKNRSVTCMGQTFHSTMSNIFLHTSSQLRVGLPTVKPLPPNPLIRAEPADDALARALAPPSETAQTDSDVSPEVPSQKELRQQLLACDQRSFLTGSAVADLQAAHIINAVRKSSHQMRKEQVQQLLSRQRLHTPREASFLLDGPSNAILLEPGLHFQWDTYGTFCFVPAKPDADAILDALRRSNQDWQELYKATRGIPARPLDITAPPFGNPHWDIIILHPHALLPDGQPILISQSRTFYLPGQPVPEPELSWERWISLGDQLCSMSEPHEPFPPFTAQDVRKHFRRPSICSLAMIINAHWKLDHFMGKHSLSATPRVRSMAALMSDLVAEIFYVPPGYPSSVLLDTVAHGHLGTASTEQSLGAGHAMMVDPPGQTSAPSSGSRYSGALDLEAPEAPEDADEDGLTNTEFQLLSAQAQDPVLDSKQRANAAMMMLFGVCSPANPYAERMQAMQAFNDVPGYGGAVDTNLISADA